MKAKVTEQGLLIPKELLEGMEDVEICREENGIRVVPIIGDDPIFQLGREPATLGIEDAATNHDRYLYT